MSVSCYFRSAAITASRGDQRFPATGSGGFVPCYWVWHCEKLCRYGVRGTNLKWFQSQPPNSNLLVQVNIIQKANREYTSEFMGGEGIAAPSKRDQSQLPSSSSRRPRRVRGWSAARDTRRWTHLESHLQLTLSELSSSHPIIKLLYRELQEATSKYEVMSITTAENGIWDDSNFPTRWSTVESKRHSKTIIQEA